MTALLDRALKLATPVLTYRTVSLRIPLRTCPDGALDLGFATVRSAALAKNLGDASELVILAATVGLGIDRLIARYGESAPSVALMLDAIGSERIEALVDAFSAALAQTHTLRPRFSPGYGDLPLALQADIFRVLDCPRPIGLSLNESLLMTPSKSVTALIGLTPTKQE